MKSNFLYFMIGFVLIALGIVFLLYYVIFGFDSNRFNDRRFDRNTWIKYYKSEDPYNPRGLMAEDVRDKVIQSRLSRSQLIELLGPPDNAGLDEHLDSQADVQTAGRTKNHRNVLKYDLGMWGSMDYYSLDFYFDYDGNFEKAQIVQH